MTSKFLTLILLRSEIAAVYFEPGEQGTVYDFYSDKLKINSDSYSKEEVMLKIKESLMSKGHSLPDENSNICIVVSSAGLVSTGIFCLSEEWSKKHSIKTASSMMLDVKWSSFLEEKEDETYYESVETVLISGGYEGCEGKKTERLIRTVSQIEWIKKRKPFVIYRGNSTVVDTAKLYFSPFTRFASGKNVLTGLESCDRKIDNVVESLYLSKCDLTESVKNYPVFVFSSILTKISEQFCSNNILKQGLIYINEAFSVFIDCERVRGEYKHRRYSIATGTCDLDNSMLSACYDCVAEDTLSSIVDFKVEKNAPFSFKETEKEDFYRPSRLIGIVLDKKIDFDKYLNLVSNPDKVRGLIEFLFDTDGYLPALASMFIRKNFDERVDFSDLIEKFPVKRGWLLIPDGDFEKDGEAVSFHVSGTTKIEPTMLLWGKRYIYEIEPSSSLEIEMKGKAYLKEHKEKKVLLKTYKSSGIMIIDLRKEAD